jgi:hypothetical protein
MKTIPHNNIQENSIIKVALLIKKCCTCSEEKVIDGFNKNRSTKVCVKYNSSKNNKMPEKFYTKEQLVRLKTLGIQGGDANDNQ